MYAQPPPTQAVINYGYIPLNVLTGCNLQYYQFRNNHPLLNRGAARAAFVINYLMKYKILLVLLLAFNKMFAASYLVHNEKEFKLAALKIIAGDTIIIANGTYAPWTLNIKATGTLNKPVMICAETQGKVIFSGSVSQPLFKIGGSYITLSGIDFQNCDLLKGKDDAGVLTELSDAKYCRITHCNFKQIAAKTQFMAIVKVSGNGISNQVDNCLFAANIDNQDIQVKITKNECPLFTMINNNVFQDKKKVSWENGNGGECVQIGQDPILLGTISAKAIVRDNRFFKCNGEPEVISNKSSDNKYIKNTFEDCEGELVMRGGHRCLIDSNTITGGESGIRINGTGHTIAHNDIRNVKTGIRLMYGMAKGDKQIGFYIAASNCIVKDNHISNAVTGLLIGDSKNVDWTGKFDTKRYPSAVMQNVAPFNNTVENNSFISTKNNVVNQ
jgi:poly(beta-D-mannuronate) lyase